MAGVRPSDTPATSPHAPDAVDVSVLVPVRDEALNLAATAASMQAQQFPGEIEFIFADGRSSDDTLEILHDLAARDRRIRVVDNPERLTPHGLNVCLREARGTFVARMDGHAQYPSDYLARGVERLGRGDVAWVSGPQLPRGEGWWSSRVTLALQSTLGRGGSRRWQPDSGSDAADELPITSGSGVFLGVWRRSTLLELDGWDEGWAANQDVELAARIEARGERIVSLASMGAFYIPRNSPRSLFRQYFRYGFFRVKTSRRHPDALRLSHLGTPCIVAALLASSLPAGAPVRRRIRTAARAASGAYGLTVLTATARVARRGEPLDWVLVPGVLAVMHVSWGVGFIAGCWCLGPPTEGLKGVVRGLRARVGGPSRPRQRRPAEARPGSA
jgi:succinoglycan biosynthesis protein ExoA